MCKHTAISRFAFTFQVYATRLVEVTEDLARHVFPASFLVVHDTRRGCEDHKAKRTSGKHCRHPLLHLTQLDRVAWRDHTALVKTADELDHNLTSAVVINDLKVANVACIVLVHLTPMSNNKTRYTPCRSHHRQSLLRKRSNAQTVPRMLTQTNCVAFSEP